MSASLNRHQAEELIRKVNDELCQQRRRLLALDTPLTILLPQHLQGLSTPDMVNYIAERLLFTLTACTHHTAALRRAKLWLVGCISYLFRYCSPDECTFYYLIKLTELPQYVRFDLFTAHRPIDDAIRVDETRPQVLDGLEVVCVMTLIAIGKVNNH